MLFSNLNQCLTTFMPFVSEKKYHLRMVHFITFIKKITNEKSVPNIIHIQKSKDVVPKFKWIFDYYYAFSLRKEVPFENGIFYHFFRKILIKIVFQTFCFSTYLSYCLVFNTFWHLTQKMYIQHNYPVP